MLTEDPSNIQTIKAGGKVVILYLQRLFWFIFFSLKSLGAKLVWFDFGLCGRQTDRQTRSYIGVGMGHCMLGWDGINYRVLVLCIFLYTPLYVAPFFVASCVRCIFSQPVFTKNLLAHIHILSRFLRFGFICTICSLH